MRANRTADIIIIGAGVYGCSIAYNLAKNGAKNVVLLERKAICSRRHGEILRRFAHPLFDPEESHPCRRKLEAYSRISPRLSAANPAFVVRAI